MKVLITGGCGFIGSNLVRYLLKREYEVCVVDDLSTGHKENIDGLGVNFFESDVCDYIPEMYSDVDAIVHLVALTNLVESNKLPVKTWNVNVNSLLQTLEYCRINYIKRLVFASSSAVEGNSIYGVTKAVGEMLCQAYQDNYDISTVCLRFSNVYGRYSNNEGVIPKFMELIKQGKKVTVYGDGKQTRDFVYVDDICQAVASSLHRGSGIYEIGSGNNISINQLILNICDVIDSPIPIERLPVRPIEILHSVADITKAKAELGYSPTVSLEQGLLDLWRSKTNALIS